MAKSSERLAEKISNAFDYLFEFKTFRGTPKMEARAAARAEVYQRYRGAVQREISSMTKRFKEAGFDAKRARLGANLMMNAAYAAIQSRRRSRVTAKRAR